MGKSPTVEEWIEHIPEMYRGIYKRGRQPKYRKDAIHSKCLDCCCWQRVEVRHCPVKTCPLWVHRPYQKP